MHGTGRSSATTLTRRVALKCPDAHGSRGPRAAIRIVVAVDDRLFAQGDLRFALEAQRNQVTEAVDAEPEETVGQADVDEWAAALAHHYAVACPVLHTDQMEMDPPTDIGVDVSGDWQRAIMDPYSPAVRNYRGYRITVHVPFEGEADVFKLRPSSWTSAGPPRGRVQGQELLLTIEYAHDSPPPIDATVEAMTRSVNQWLGFAQPDIDAFNRSLEQHARQAIERRRERIDRRDAHVAQSSIPVRRPGESGGKTYLPDVLVRRPAPSLPQTRADQTAPQLEPVLEARIFEHILGVIRMHARQMEQSPGTYASMGEEDRRQTIVATLNTHYEGRAHAEAFNTTGKTDILIRYEGRNLFICECKFWSGSEGFRDTIDQLFGYAAWRDTKLAIVMFVRERGLSAIIEKARTVVAGHDAFVAWKDASSETELRAIVHWPGDDQKLADLNVFFVHTPAAR